jgi:deazaflavin-dependent oxidoreductase (nitroreductase family)
MLVHIGRSTGLHRCTVLEIMEYRTEGPEMIVMSGFGPNADWLRNIEAKPDGFEVVIGSKRFAAAHRVLEDGEALEVITGYERRNRFTAPIIRTVLSHLLGWRYDSSERARRQLIAQLPLIAFRPRSLRPPT